MLTLSLRPCQATDAEAKDDREIVCSEVFADVTGTVDNNAQGTICTICKTPIKAMPALHTGPCPLASVCLGFADRLNVRAGARFYEVLAPYFNQVCCFAQAKLSTTVLLSPQAQSTGRPQVPTQPLDACRIGKLQMICSMSAGDCGVSPMSPLCMLCFCINGC